MSTPAAAEGTAAPNQPLMITLLSMGLIALTALGLQWLSVPAEVTASLATASGALVPAMAIRRREAKKGKENRVLEIVSGNFKRPPVYVLLIAAGLLGIAEYVSTIVLVIFFAVPLAQAYWEGTLTEEEFRLLLSETSMAINAAALFGGLMALVVAVPVGSYVAHRIGEHPFRWAVVAVVLYQGVSLAVALIASIAVDPLAVAMPALLVSAPICFGVYLGRRTRSLFLARRLFHSLSEGDRGAVLGLMYEAQVAKRLPS